MENVLSGFVIIFLILSSVLTLFGGGMAAQDKVQQSWETAQERIDAQTRTHLTALSAKVTDSGEIVEVTLKNDGQTRLMEFDHWDAIVQYPDENLNSHYHVEWLPYVAHNLDVNEWTVSGLYIDSRANLPEEYEPSIFNTGEEMIARLHLRPALLPGASAQITFASENGARVTTFAHRNVPPVLATNTGVTVPAGGSIEISEAQLLTTDADNTADELLYRVVTPPLHGTLTLGDTFTQDDIDKGFLKYRSGSDPDETDSFDFTVTDGTDMIGPYTFSITINKPPTLDTNAGLTASGTDPITIDSSLLKVSDPDNSAAELTYTVTTGTAKGNLSLSTFTQDDIDSGRLTYTPTDTGPDAFHFTVSDGVNTIGPYIFDISS